MAPEGTGARDPGTKTRAADALGWSSSLLAAQAPVAVAAERERKKRKKRSRRLQQQQQQRRRRGAGEWGRGSWGEGAGESWGESRARLVVLQWKRNKRRRSVWRQT